jgi:hypothetical protein
LARKVKAGTQRAARVAARTLNVLSEPFDDSMLSWVELPSLESETAK